MTRISNHKNNIASLYFLLCFDTKLQFY